MADSRGILHAGRANLTGAKAELAAITNRSGLTGSIGDALVGADVFLGLSAGAVGEQAISRMAPGAIVFALANPNPEVDPELAHRYAAVVATGRSDYPNQINNVLAFPGVFAGRVRRRRAGDHRGHEARRGDRAQRGRGRRRSSPTCIVPTPFDPRVAPAVAAAVAAQAVADGVAREPAAV